MTPDPTPNPLPDATFPQLTRENATTLCADLEHAGRVYRVRVAPEGDVAIRVLRGPAPSDDLWVYGQVRQLAFEFIARRAAEGKCP